VWEWTSRRCSTAILAVIGHGQDARNPRPLRGERVAASSGRVRGWLTNRADALRQPARHSPGSNRFARSQTSKNRCLRQPASPYIGGNVPRGDGKPSPYIGGNVPRGDGKPSPYLGGTFPHQ